MQGYTLAKCTQLSRFKFQIINLLVFNELLVFIVPASSKHKTKIGKDLHFHIKQIFSMKFCHFNGL